MKIACLPLVAILLCVLGMARAEEKPEKPTLQTILDAWRQRQKAMESFDFHWRVKAHVDAQKEQLKLLDGTTYEKRPESTFFERYRLATDAHGNSRLEIAGRQWVAPLAQFFPSAIDAIYENGMEKMILTPPIAERNYRNYPKVTAHRVYALKSITQPRPINMMLRPLDPVSGGFDPQTLKLSNETDSVDNAPTLILTDEHNKIWVDPSQDFVPVKCIETGERMKNYPYTIQYTIAYDHDKTHGWLPHAWTISEGDSDESATVTEYTINQPIPAKEFKLELPGGAIIEDLADNTISIIYPDGKHRQLKPGEFNGKNFQDLLDTESDSK